MSTEIRRNAKNRVIEGNKKKSWENFKNNNDALLIRVTIKKRMCVKWNKEKEENRNQAVGKGK